MNETVELVVFDFDGVVLNSEPYHFYVREALIKEYCNGIEYDAAVCTGKSVETFYFELLERCGVHEKTDELAKRLAQKHFSLVYESLAEHGVMANEGLSSFLDELKKRKINVALASSSDSSYIKRSLGRLGLLEEFDVICCGDDVDEPKPSPDIYRLALKLTGVDGTKAMAVEDSRSGIESANRAGVRCVGYMPGAKTKDAVIPGCIGVVSSFAGILPFLEL